MLFLRNYHYGNIEHNAVADDLVNNNISFPDGVVHSEILQSGVERMMKEAEQECHYDINLLPLH